MAASMLLIIASGCWGVCGNAALETRSKVVATTIAQKVTRDNKGRWTDCRMTMLLFVLTDNRVASTPRGALLVFSRAPLDAPVANLQMRRSQLSRAGVPCAMPLH